MKVSEMELNSEIEACRTCGVFFLTSSNILRHLFSNEPEILLVRKELEAWKVQLNENDVFPKYICTICLLEFHRIFKFQNAVFETQQQLQQLYNFQQENIQKIKIKTEICEDPQELQKNVAKSLPEEPNVCAFVYVDDMSDDEYDNHENRHITPFKVPHLPIKDEIIEEAYIPKGEETLTPEMSVPALTRANVIGKEIQPIERVVTGIQCELCLHVSEDQQKHRQHLLRIHEMKPVECHVCGKQFPSGTTETRLKYHMKWHRINKHIKCSQCGFHCPSRDVLNEHMRAVHTKTPCKICGKLLLPKKMHKHLEKHQQTESQHKLDCPYCASYFATSDEKNQHVSLFHSTTQGQLSMSSFDMSTETVELNVASSSLQSEAEISSISFETTLTTIASSAPNANSQFFENADSEASYEAKAELEETLTENTNQDPYVATENFADDNCEPEFEDFMDNGNLCGNDETEVESIAQEMQFACAQCPQSFKRVQELIAHAETHSEKTKAFECNVCGKTFDLKFSLNRHMKKHKNTTL